MSSTLITATSHALLRGEAAPPVEEEPTEPVERAALRLAALLGRGEYAAALQEPLAATLLDAPDCAAAVQAYLAEHALVAPAAATGVVWLGAACLCWFAQLNWTGPVTVELDTATAATDAAAAAEPASPHAKRADSEALESLAVNGEPAYALLRSPGLLRAARALLVAPHAALRDADAASAGPAWWASRCLSLHLRCLESSKAAAPSLERDATQYMRDALERLEPAPAGAQGAEGAAVAPLLKRRVLVVGLEGRPELNSQRGVASSFDAAKGRYAVRLDGGGKEAPLLLKAHNLLAEEEAVQPPRQQQGKGPASGVSPNEALGATARETIALARLEAAQALLRARLPAPAEVELRRAQRTLGLSLALGGARGKRTKFQQTAVSLLIMRATLGADALPRPETGVSETGVPAAAAAAAAAAAVMPTSVAGDDDTLLEVMSLEDEADPPPLTELEQLAALAECVWVSVQRPHHASTAEEMAPYADAVLGAPASWAVATQALRTRLRLEIARPRRRHRALMQLEALVDNLDPDKAGQQTFLGRHLGEPDAPEGADAQAAGGGADTAAAGGGGTAAAGEENEAGGDDTAAAAGGGGAAESEAAAALRVQRARSGACAQRRGSSGGACAAARLKGFWGVALLPQWQLRAELARTLAMAGLISEAISLFKSLELWEDMVAALMMFPTRKDEAIDLVRSEIERSPTPMMWCNLGELTGDEDAFHTAWRLSARGVATHTCARAKLSLGAAAMKRDAWDEARTHLHEACEVRPHSSEAWYASAVCSLHLEQEEQALTDLRRVVSLDPQHPQAWASLAALFARSKQRKEALFAYRESCRLQPTAPSFWLGAAMICFELGLFEESVFRAKRALDVGSPPDAELASLLAQVAAKSVASLEGVSGSRLAPRVQELCALHCEKEPGAPKHWAVRAYLARECGPPAEQRAALLGQLDALRARPEWRTELAALDLLSEVAAQLVEARLEGGDQKEAEEVRAIVTVLLHGATEHLAASQGADGLRMLKTRLDRHFEDLD